MEKLETERCHQEVSEKTAGQGKDPETEDKKSRYSKNKCSLNTPLVLTGSTSSTLKNQSWRADAW